MTGTPAAQALPFGELPRAPEGHRVNLRLFEWIWHVKGSVALAPGQSGEDAFDRLDPLFRERGTTRDRTSDTLTFSKTEAAAQDKMTVFSGGVLKIEQDAAGSVLRYRLASRALLFCFLAPLLFLVFAQATVFIGKFEKPKTETKDKKADAKKAPVALNPIDKFLGAPAPEKPKKKGADKDDDKKPSPTPAYVFAGIFAALYVVGRIVEGWRIKALFRSLLGA